MNSWIDTNIVARSNVTYRASDEDAVWHRSLRRHAIQESNSAKTTFDELDNGLPCALTGRLFESKRMKRYAKIIYLLFFFSQIGIWLSYLL